MWDTFFFTSRAERRPFEHSIKDCILNGTLCGSFVLVLFSVSFYCFFVIKSFLVSLAALSFRLFAVIGFSPLGLANLFLVPVLFASGIPVSLPLVAFFVVLAAIFWVSAPFSSSGVLIFAVLGASVQSFNALLALCTMTVANMGTRFRRFVKFC